MALDVRHDLVDLGCGGAIHSLDQPIDHLGTAGVGPVKLLQGRQVAGAELFVRLTCLDCQGRRDGQRDELLVDAVKSAARGRGAFLERGRVAFELGRVATAQQNIFPFLYLDLEMDLGLARSIGGLGHPGEAIHLGQVLGIGHAQRIRAAQADTDQGDEEEGRKQTEARCNLDVIEFHRRLQSWRGSGAPHNRSSKVIMLPPAPKANSFRLQAASLEPGRAASVRGDGCGPRARVRLLSS